MEVIFFLYLILIFLSNLYLKKKNYLSSNYGFIHQTKVNDSVPLIGGIYLFLPFVLVSILYEISLILPLIGLFVLGLLSDLNIFSSAKKRFFIQLLLISSYIFLSNLEVLPTRISLIDTLFSDTYLSLIFTIFCFLILINGSNFIDGLNGLLLGYCTLILFITFKLNLNDYFILNDSLFMFILIILILLLFLNFLNKLFLGDNGAYMISFFIGFYLITIYNQNFQNITPYFVILLLWYPCFENLFSILRKIYYKKNPLTPDNHHLHHYLYLVVKNKISKKKIIANNLSSVFILTFNGLIFYFSVLDINNTLYQLKLLALCVTTYLVVYISLKKFKNL